MPPGGVRNARSTKLDMVIEEVRTILMSSKSVRIQRDRRIVSPLRGLKIWGKNTLLNLNPLTLKPLVQIHPNFNT